MKATRSNTHSPLSMLLTGLVLGLAVSQAHAESTGEHIANQGASQPGAVACSSCHGVDGGGNEQAGFPRLAGLSAAYLDKQLHAFKQGSNKNPVMAAMAASLNDADIKNVAAYYASLPPVSHAHAPADVPLSAGKQLAIYGDMATRGLPACIQCHGPGGLGVGTVFPALAGQTYSYIVAQIKAWNSAQRSGDPMGLMKHVATLLTEDESRSVAAYFASQPIVANKVSTANPRLAKVVKQSAALPALPYHGEVAPGREVGAEGYFQSPPHGAYPAGPLGEKIRLGEAIFTATNTSPVSGQYVGNKQVCQGCHLDGGRLANAAPMWASWVAYPAYRKKTKSINTIVERIQGCFKYSMNAKASKAGRPPATESDTIIALVSYMYWLASGAPTGDNAMPGRGYAKLAETTQGFDPVRGQAVYANKCAVCHGKNGEGQFAQGELVFPPLWGAASYNWGAGMHAVNTAAAYIKLNMPFGLASAAKKTAWLSDQEAWDVAAYMNAQERPQDPRFTGSVAETRKKFHGSKFDYYGTLKKPDGKVLGDGAP